MPNSTTHFTAGVITAVILFLAMGYFGISRIVLFLGAMLCIMVSEFPDIDQHNSIPRKVMRHLLPGVVIALSLYLFFSWRVYSESLLHILLFIAVPVAFLTVYERFIPAHRKEVHKLPGLVAVALLMWLISAFLNLSMMETTAIILFGSAGFISHIALDTLM
ncbi:MAG TPA: hypothetical protein ENN30_00710 [Candidatus Woesearchaeota archaeon]|nr:hypothetical protein [Candidatus Woesearchaeota archaeon]